MVRMIPAGYMAKRIVQRPNWLNAPAVKDIYSVSGCTSKDFMDYIKLWRHNGYWLFNHAQIIHELARENDIDLSDATLFYYEVFENEFDEEAKQWQSFKPEAFHTQVLPPPRKTFRGYDVVTFSMGTTPECSPLSCNHLASEIKTNAHCLLESFEGAKKDLELGKFNRSEPGPFRIFAVYTIETSQPP